MNLGATSLGDGRCSFLVWASRRDRVEVVLDGDRTVPLEPGRRGYYSATVDHVPPGTRYRYRLDGEVDVADPASRWQPDGVHGPSAVADPTFEWHDDGWFGLPVADLVIYELHVGTFTAGRTFDAAIERLDALAALGITAIEVMPVAEFPGARNWGYDGVLPFAAQSSYGGPDGFRRLVDACHQRGLAVILDVVYNHFGPEGAVQSEYGDYFTERYSTPWGPALNFDGPGSGDVRRYFIENALWWVDDCHVDGLRLDAVHAILDQSAYHFLHELADAVHARAQRSNRRIHVIAESDLNDPRLIRVPEVGGFGLDGQWSDDFHHSLHALLTGELEGYYSDFGAPEHLATAMANGYVLLGGYSAHRGRAHGAPTTGLPGERFVVCAQNHDQVGNRMLGDRLSALVDPAGLRIAATCVLLSPFVPLLFMGEEYGETAPFQYFVSHSDPDLVESVRSGRREEFSAFEWQGEAPDPQAESTFEASTLDHSLVHAEPHASLHAYHAELLRLRRELEPLRALDRDRTETHATAEGVVAWHRWSDDDAVLVVVNVSAEPARVGWSRLRGGWEKVLDSTSAEWGGSSEGDGGAPPRLEAGDTGAARVPGSSAAVYRRTEGAA